MRFSLRSMSLLLSVLFFPIAAAVSQIDFSGVTLNTDPADVYHDLERVVRCISPNLSGGCRSDECEELARLVEALWTDLTDYGKIEVLKLFGDFYLDQFYGDEPWRSGASPSFGSGAWDIAGPDERITGSARVTKFDLKPFEQGGRVTMTLGASLFVVPGEGHLSILTDDPGYWTREIRGHGGERWRDAAALPPHPTLFSSWYDDEYTSILDFFAYEMEIVVQRYLIEALCAIPGESSSLEEFHDALVACMTTFGEENYQPPKYHLPLWCLCGMAWSPDGLSSVRESEALSVHERQHWFYRILMAEYEASAYAEQVFASWMFERYLAEGCAIPDQEAEYRFDMPFEYCTDSWSQYYTYVTKPTGDILYHDQEAKRRAVENLGCHLEM